MGSIRILPTFEGYKEGSLCYRTGADLEDCADLSKWAIDTHHVFGPGAVKKLYERLLLGQNLPEEMILTSFGDDTAVAVALFLKPDLVLRPSCGPLVASVDLVHRLGRPFLPHLPDDHRAVLESVRVILTAPATTEPERVEKLKLAATIVDSYLTFGSVPNVKLGFTGDLTVWENLSDGESGFLVASSEGFQGLDELFELGCLFGVMTMRVCDPEDTSPKQVLIFKKSEIIGDFDPPTIAQALNHHEFGASVEDPSMGGWKYSPLSCGSPQKHPFTGERMTGTTLPIEFIVETARRYLPR